MKNIIKLIILAVIIMMAGIKIGFADFGKGLEEKSLEELRLEEKRLQKEVDRVREEIELTKKILEHESEIKERQTEKRKTLTPGTPEYEVSIIKPQAARLERELKTLQEHEKLILTKIQLVDDAIKTKERTEFLRKKQLRYVSVNLGAIARENSNKDGNDYNYFADIEVDLRVPLGSWWTAGPFVGYGDGGYVGVEIFIPVAKPNLTDDPPVGLWGLTGIIHTNNENSLFIGLNIEGVKHKWRLFCRGWSQDSWQLLLGFPF